jgi:hypothetical protein
MATTFEQTYKLANLVSTIPLLVASVKQSFSNLERIRTYNHSTQSLERLGHLSLLSTEKVLAADLKKPNFCDQVIKKLRPVDVRPEFHFR